jgi:plasmid stabilization system protein ParE
VPGRQLRFNPLAEAELFEAARWYDESLPGLGAAFVEAVHDATTMVLEAPKRWRPVLGTRRYLMGRFPFAIVYREISEEEVEVVAVAHLKRRQRHWSKR